MPARWYDEKPGRVVHGRTTQLRMGRAGTSHGTAKARADRHREAVVKIVSWGKSARSVRRFMHYISEGSKHLKSPELLLDENGQEFRPDEANTVAQDWRLKSNTENESKAAREAETDEDYSAMPEKDRLRERQAVHMVFSFHKSHGMSREDVTEITRDALEDIRARGHRFVMSAHMDADNPHVHVIVKAKSENGPRLRLQPADIQELREKVAVCAQERGFAMRATPPRRADRTAEDEQARPTRFEASGAGKEKAQDPAKRGRTLLERQAPRWYARNGAAFEARRTGFVSSAPIPEPRPCPLPALPEKSQIALDKTFAGYQEPERAKREFLEMAADNPKTAFWYANKRPDVFGDRRADSEPVKVRDREIRLPPAWQKGARAALDAAIGNERPEALDARAKAAEAARSAPRRGRAAQPKPATTTAGEKPVPGLFRRALDFIKRNPTQEPKRSSQAKPQPSKSAGLAARGKAGPTAQQREETRTRAGNASEKARGTEREDR